MNSFPTPEDEAVFISHSSADRNFVEREIIDCLRNVGVATWYSREDIRTSDEWERKLLHGLEACQRFLLVMSAHSAESEWVKSEVHWAMQNRWPERIIPVLIDECRPESFHLWLARVQYLDFRTDRDQARRALVSLFGRDLPSPETSGPEEAQPESSTAVPPEVVAPQIRGALRMPRFHCGGIVPPECFIDRYQELEDAEGIVRSGQSFLLVGVRRSGKSSFLKKLRHRILGVPDNTILSSTLNLEACRDLTIETFLGHTILNMIGEISREVFHIKPTDLSRPDPAEVRQELKDDKEFDAFVNINRQVVARTHSQAGLTPSPFLPHEFVGFAKDLLEIVRSRGWSHYVVFYDEANHLPMRLSIDLLEGNLEALNSARLTSVYAATPEMADSFRTLHDLFGHQISIGPFESQRDQVRLLAQYYYGNTNETTGLPVSADSLQTVWELAGGMPFQIQFLLNFSFQYARQHRAELVAVDHVTKAFDLLSRDRPEYFRPRRHFR